MEKLYVVKRRNATRICADGNARELRTKGHDAIVVLDPTAQTETPFMVCVREG